MAPGDVCHGPRCSLAGLRPVALEYRSCPWPGGSAGSPRCVQPMGCWLFPVPCPPYVCAVSRASWLLFTVVLARFVVLGVRCPGPLGSCSPVCPLGVVRCACGVPAPWVPFTGVPAGCVVLRVWCPVPLGSCSPVRLLRVLLCVRGVLGHLAPVHRCACSVFCFVCAVSWATWLLFTGVPARFVVLYLRCPGPLGSCSPVCPLGVLCCLCGVLGPLAPALRCARSVCCVACAVSWATWLLFTGALARCVALRARCPGSLGSCSPVCLRCLFFCLCGVLVHLAPVHQCVRAVCCVVSAVSWATWLLFTGVSARCFVLPVWRPGPLGPRSSVCPLGVLCCVCGVLGHLAPVHRCARSVCCFACPVSRAFWLLFTGVPGRGISSLCCPRCMRVRSVLALVAPVHRCARCVRCACAIGGCVRLPTPLIFVLFFFYGEKKKKKRKKKTGARVHCRHRHGQLVRRCNSVVSSGVCRRCCGGGRAPGVRLERPDVHGYGPGWVWLGVSLLLELAG